MFVGIDSLEKERFTHLANNDAFLNKVFTPYEINYANQTENKTMRLAGMYCAKEAFLKALQLGIGGGIALGEIEVNHLPSGAPLLVLTQNAKTVLQKFNITNVQISITHTKNVSTAICICS